MRVRCIRIPSPVEGAVLESSPWVTVGREYTVLSLIATFKGFIRLQLRIDDERGLRYFASDCFVTVDTSIPPNWIARVRDGGHLEFAPESWQAVGFWESYYDDDPAAREAVDRELLILLPDPDRVAGE